LKKHRYYHDGNPITHTLLVEEVSSKISDMLISNGINIDRDIVRAAALLHDIGKEDKGYTDHDERGYRICLMEELDPKICIVVKNHDMNGVLGNLDTWEEKVVSYSDKICNTKILGLDERFEDWRRRFPEHYEKHKETALRAAERSRILEKEILNKLKLTPQELYDVLRKK
jgi:putative nucleotidyltransferase with HDIG domain